MKKLTLLAACALTATMAFGQGKVQFANTPAFPITTNLTGGASGSMVGAGAYVVGLFIGPAGSSFSSLTMVPTTTTSKAAAGIFSGGGSFVLPSPGDGSSAIAFQVRAWSVGLGATWADVTSKLDGTYAGVGRATANFSFAPGTYYLGSSAIGSVLPATGIGLPPALFGTGAGQIGGFAMTDVIPTPEPGTLALVGLGLTGLLFIRRRK
jgi:hypothetical protein